MINYKLAIVGSFLIPVLLFGIALLLLLSSGDLIDGARVK